MFRSTRARRADRTSNPQASAAAVLLALGCLEVGCGADFGSSNRPLLISGSVHLSSNLFTEFGSPKGTRDLEDADSLRILLLSEGAPVESTWVMRGRFALEPPAPGRYTLAVRISPELLFSSTPFDCGADGIDLEAPLHIESSGGLGNPPNPFPSAHGVGMEGISERGGLIRYRVYTLSGREVFHYDLDANPLGFFHLHWSPEAYPGTPTPAGAYWTVVEVDGSWRYNLVFKEG